jgi:hypothetical protein
LAVAWTTVISEALEAALTMVFLIDKHYGFVRMSLRHYVLDLKSLWEVLRNGVPAGVETLIFSISNVVIQAAANQYLTASAVAGNTASDNLEGYIFVVLEAFAVAVSSVSPLRIYGANKKENLAKPFSIRFPSSPCSGFLMGGIAALCRGRSSIFWLRLLDGELRLFRSYDTGPPASHDGAHLCFLRDHGCLFGLSPGPWPLAGSDHCHLSSALASSVSSTFLCWSIIFPTMQNVLWLYAAYPLLLGIGDSLSTPPFVPGFQKKAYASIDARLAI